MIAVSHLHGGASVPQLFATKLSKLECDVIRRDAILIVQKTSKFNICMFHICTFSLPLRLSYHDIYIFSCKITNYVKIFVKFNLT